MNTEEMGRMKISQQQVHDQLSGLYGKRIGSDSLNVLKKMVQSKLISKKNVVGMFTDLSKEGKFSRTVLKNVLSTMIEEKMMTKKEVKESLVKLQTSKVITNSDIYDILSFLKITK